MQSNAGQGTIDEANEANEADEANEATQVCWLAGWLAGKVVYGTLILD